MKYFTNKFVENMSEEISDDIWNLNEILINLRVEEVLGALFKNATHNIFDKYAEVLFYGGCCCNCCWGSTTLCHNITKDIEIYK